jgi:hypothetical protein
MNRAVIEARENVHRAEKALAATVKRAFPKGTRVTFRMGRGNVPRIGIVLDHGRHYDGVKLRNVVTQTEYWISSYFIDGCQR